MFPSMCVNITQAKEINDLSHNGNYMKKSVLQISEAHSFCYYEINIAQTFMI